MAVRARACGCAPAARATAAGWVRREGGELVLRGRRRKLRSGLVSSRRMGCAAAAACCCSAGCGAAGGEEEKEVVSAAATG